MPDQPLEEDSGAVPTQNTHGLQMAPQRMLELAQKAAELIVAASRTFPETTLGMVTLGMPSTTP